MLYIHCLKKIIICVLDPVISHGDQLLSDHQESYVIKLKPYLTRLEPELRQQEPDLSRLESYYHEDLSPDTAQEFKTINLIFV